VVIDCDENSKYKIGDEVFGITRGSLAEYILVGINELTHKPNNISHE